MDKKTTSVLLAIVLGCCYCFTQMTGCEMSRHRTYAPSILSPTVKIEKTAVKIVPIKDDK